jgi:HK97 family phage portal protein
MKLPIIGQVSLGRKKDEDIIQVVEAIDVRTAEAAGVDKKDKFVGILGGLLEFGAQRLSSNTTSSSKLLHANREWVYRNNDVIALEASKMNFELYKIGLQGGEITYTEIFSHPLLSLLDKPNNEEVKSDAVYIIQSHKKLTGDAFWLKVRTGKQVTALRHLPPDKIKLELRSPTADDPTAIESYRYEDVIDGQKIDVVYQPEDIIHFKKPNPNNPFRGLGTVEAMADTIDIDNLTNLTTRNFFEKGAITNFVLSTDKNLSDDQLKRLRAELRQDYTGAANAYKTMILGGGLTPERISFSNKDMEFLQQLEWYRDKIMCGFGNTLASLGMLDDVNRATHESAMIEWKRITVKPDMDAIVNALNEFLVPEFGDNLILGYTDPIPEDREDMLTEAKDLFGSGLVTRNEARELLSYESVINGDIFFVPMGGTLEDEAGIKLNDDEQDDQADAINSEDDLVEDPEQDEGDQDE